MGKSVKRSKYWKCNICGEKIFESKINDHQKEIHNYDSTKEPNYIRYPQTGFAQ